MAFEGLKYKDGDVLVQLSSDSSELLLLHRHVLADRSAYFKAMLGDVWSRPEMIPDGNNLRPLWKLNLVVDTKDLTYFLVAEVSSQETH
jgi:hypothetical protein